VLTKNVFRHKIATQGHSFCNQLSHFIKEPAAAGPTRGSISPYNIAGLMSKVSEEVAIEIAENCRRPRPHRHLTPPPWGTPANICTCLRCSETRVIGLHFRRW